MNWGSYDLKKAVFEKFKRYNKAVEDCDITEFKLVYKSGDVIKHIPGTETLFTVKKNSNKILELVTIAWLFT